MVTGLKLILFKSCVLSGQPLKIKYNGDYNNSFHLFKGWQYTKVFQGISSPIHVSIIKWTSLNIEAIIGDFPTLFDSFFVGNKWWRPSQLVTKLHSQFSTAAFWISLYIYIYIIIYIYIYNEIQKAAVENWECNFVTSWEGLHHLFPTKKESNKVGKSPIMASMLRDVHFIILTWIGEEMPWKTFVYCQPLNKWKELL